jgi:hypothetical protein
LGILGKNNGIDDKLRAAGLGESMIETIMGMGAKDAQKWMKKNIKGGRLTVAGSAEQRVQLAATAAAAQSEAQGSIARVGYQSQALAMLQTGKFGKPSAEAMGIIAGDPKIAEAYVAKVREAQKLERIYNNKGGEARRKAWKAAQKVVKEYVEELVNAQRAEEGFAARLETLSNIASNEDALKFINQLQAGGASQEIVNAVREDPQKYASMWFAAQQEVEQKEEDWRNAKPGKAKKAAKKELDAAKNVLKNLPAVIQKEIDSQKALRLPIEIARESFEQMSNTVNAWFDREYAKIETQNKIEFEIQFGKSIGQVELDIEKRQDLIDGYRDEIDVIQDSIKAIERRRGAEDKMSEWGLEQLQRKQELLNQEIRDLERLNELDQRRIEKLQREDDIRNRVSEALSHELEMMGHQEEKIREAYDKRFKALDKVAKINDYIINQQRKQLDLSRAISEGDIYAATAAAQEMRAESAQFSRDQLRTGLEDSMEKQIENLTTSTGLNRKKAEEEIRKIKEQSYQTSLQIRDIEDAIYKRQQTEILPLKDQQYAIESAIQKLNNEIYEKQQQILKIEREKIEPAEKINALQKEQIDDTLLKIKEEQLNIKHELFGTREQWDNIALMQSASLAYEEALTDETVASRDAAVSLAAAWKSVGQQINNAFKARQGAFKDIDLWKPEKGESAADFKARRESARAAAQRDYDIAVAAALNTPGLSLESNSPSPSTSSTISFGGPSENARWIMMPGGNMLTGQALDEGIIYMDKNGRFRWKKTDDNKLVPGMPSGDMRKYGMGGKIKGYGKGGKMLRYPMGGLIPYAFGGSVLGDGSRDSVLAKLTPGEFVIRKTMVDKYGIPLLEALNQGAFSLPKYNVGNANPTEVKASVNMANINAPVYNTYDMKFAVNGSNASADEIANKVMFKMKQVQNQGIRSNRAY